ncbi:MAG TPA: TonB family protein [Candidatus Baltobacteraceae bacterium]|jgi:TonB family protein
MAENKNDSPYLTTGERVRNFLGWAFLISLAIHFIVAPFLPNLQKSHEDNTTEKVSVTKKIKVKVPTPPPPSPTPPPTPTPPPQATPPPHQQQKAPPKLKLNVPKTTSKNSSSANSQPKYVPPPVGSQNGVPNGQGTNPPATPVPQPVVTAKPACKVPFQDATVTNEVPPEYPDSARSLGLGTVTVLVKVAVGPSGSLQNATVYQSSNNLAIDQSALSAARQSTYAPKIVNCQPTSGDYLFRAQFDPSN